MGRLFNSVLNTGPVERPAASPFTKNCTCATEPSASAAAAASVKLAGAKSTEPSVGFVSARAGGWLSRITVTVPVCCGRAK